MTKELIDVASGQKKADLVLKNAQIVNVFTQEIIKGSVAIFEGLIAGIGDYSGENEIDLNGAYILPGLIDSHVHIESSFVSPRKFAELVLPFGTTSIIADPHEIANVCGEDGIRFMIEDAKESPLNTYFMIPSCVPATSFENAGAEITAETIELLLKEEEVLGLGEMMDYPAVISGNPAVLKKLQVTRKNNMIIDGHGPAIEKKELMAYRAGGIQTDHECSTVEEMQARLRAGIKILIREGSAGRNLAKLIKGVSRENIRRCSFCTDDKNPDDIIQEGHIDFIVRSAIDAGIDPVNAIQMATINAAETYGLSNKGAIAPGYDADIIITDNLRLTHIQAVYSSGVLVAKDGQSLYSSKPSDIRTVGGNMNVKNFTSDSFRLPLKNGDVNVIRIHPGSIVTETVVRSVPVDSKGFFEFDRTQNISKLAVIERHKGTGNIGLGLVEKYGVRNGAVATTIAHDSHNIIVAGDNDADMFKAVSTLIEEGGGLTLVKNGAVLETLQLPIAGLMSDKSTKDVNNKLNRMILLARKELKINEKIDAFMTLSFLALPVIPDIKLTDMGLFDVTKFDFMDINAN